MCLFVFYVRNLKTWNALSTDICSVNKLHPRKLSFSCVSLFCFKEYLYIGYLCFWVQTPNWLKWQKAPSKVCLTFFLSSLLFNHSSFFRLFPIAPGHEHMICIYGGERQCRQVGLVLVEAMAWPENNSKHEFA